jgi:hypothetical protein
LVHGEVWEVWDFFQQKLIFAVLCTVLGVIRSWHRIWAHYCTAMCITYYVMLYYSSFIWKNPVVPKCTEQIMCPWWNWTIFQFLVLKNRKKQILQKKISKFPKILFSLQTRLKLIVRTKKNCKKNYVRLLTYYSSYCALHGSSLDIKKKFFFFFVSYVSLNLSDDVFEGKNLFFP